MVTCPSSKFVLETLFFQKFKVSALCISSIIITTLYASFETPVTFIKMADLKSEITRKELKLTIRSIAEIKSTIENEYIEHRDTVEDLKATIKNIQADILAIRSETFPSAVETRRLLAQKQSAQKMDIQSKRAAIESEIEELKQRITNDETIHTYKISLLEQEIQELQQKKACVLSKKSVEVEETELELRKLTEECLTNKTVLDELEERLEVEKMEQQKIEEREAARLEEDAKMRASEETKHYASLLIQNRWKRFKKRQLLKLQTKGKKGKKKGAKKKTS